MSAADSADAGDRRARLAIALGLVAAVALAFGRVARNGFIDFDDPIYITENPFVYRGLTRESLTWAFTAFHAGNWHPLTWLSHIVDCELFGLSPGPHHLVSLALHAANAALLWFALERLTRATWTSAFAAALFALHPQRVESVAWAAERKDVLSGLFFMLTLLSYARYAERPSILRFALVACGLACGLLAKPMLVTLPLVLLLLDFWPLGRLGARESGERERYRVMIEKVPLFLIVGVSSAVTFFAQRASQAVGPVSALPIGARLANAATSTVAYLRQMVWPSDLAYYYSHPALSDKGFSVLGAILAATLVVAATSAVLLAARRRPFLAVGWLWYLGMLVPVIGLVQVGMQARADRYTYLPSIGVALIVAHSAAELAARSARARTAVVGVASVVLLALALTTSRQVGTWKSSLTLAEQALAVTRDNYRAHSLRGGSLVEAGRLDEAEVDLRRALAIEPGCSECLLNLGVLQAKRGRARESEATLRLALSVNPLQASPHLNLGVLYEQQGLDADALEEFKLALAIDPLSPEALAGIGVMLARQGEVQQGTQQVERALALRPHFPEAWVSLGGLYRAQGRTDDAREAYERAAALAPQVPGPELKLGELAEEAGDTAGAVEHYAAAARRDPAGDEAGFRLALAYAAAGRVNDAVAEFERLLEVHPDLASAHYNLGVLLIRRGELPRAARHLERSLALDPGQEAARRALESLR